MTDAALSFVTSADGSSWSKPKNIVNGYTDYGLQMAVYRGELYGIMTQTVQYPNQLFATKYKIDEGWKSWRSLPSQFLSQGRVSVTVLEDRFFIARRGTNDAVYLCWTDDFENFHDVGRIGSKYSTSVAAPAIAAHDGMLFLTGVGPDKYIYYVVCDKDGNRVMVGDKPMSWTKIPGTGTQSALSMVVYSGKLYLLHCGYNGDKIFYQHIHSDGTWSDLESLTTNITSGPSAVVWKYDTMVVSYRGKDEDIKYQAFNGKSWTKKQYVPDVYMKYQTGLSTWAGRLVISFAEKQDSKKLWGYQPRAMIMSEKTGAFGEVEEVDDWNCKWNQQEPEEKKAWIRRMFCM